MLFHQAALLAIGSLAIVRALVTRPEKQSENAPSVMEIDDKGLNIVKEIDDKALKKKEHDTVRRSAYHAGHEAVAFTKLIRRPRPIMNSAKGTKLIQLADSMEPDIASSFATPFKRLSSRQSYSLRVHRQAFKEVQQKGRHSLTAPMLLQRDVLDDTGADFHLKPASEVLAMTRLKGLDSTEYVGPIGVGTRSQPGYCSDRSAVSLIERSRDEECLVREQESLNVVFDTGSTNLWMASTLCETKQCSEGRKRYDSSRSTTYKAPEVPLALDIKFGTAELAGPQAIDDFHIGPFTVKNQSFGMIEKEEGSTFAELPLEGIVGLGFPSMAAVGSKPFFDTVIEQHVLSHNEFSFFFDSSEGKDSAAILWGGVDPHLHSEPIRMIPVIQPHYWALALHSLKIGDKDVIEQPSSWRSWLGSAASFTEPTGATMRRHRPKPLNVKLVVDTGTNSFTAPPEVYDVIARRLPDTDCKEARKYPNISFTVQDAAGDFLDLVVPPTEYMGATEDGFCQLAFMSLEVYEPWGPCVLLGETFLRNYLTVFDRGDGTEKDARVGFARSKKGPETTRILSSLQEQQNFLKKRVAAAAAASAVQLNN